MGLFDKVTEYGGNFTRKFDQRQNDQMLQIFAKSDTSFALASGVCAGATFDMVRYRLTIGSVKNYTNYTMKQNADSIIAVQKHVRKKDIALSTLLKSCGLIEIKKQNIDGPKSLLSEGIHIISHDIPPEKGGRHVALVIREIDRQGNVYLKLFDVLSGDVDFSFNSRQNEKCLDWLKEYFNIYREIGAKQSDISHFSFEYNSLDFSKNYTEILEKYSQDSSKATLIETTDNNLIEESDKLMTSTKALIGQGKYTPATFSSYVAQKKPLEQKNINKDAGLKVDLT